MGHFPKFNARLGYIVSLGLALAILKLVSKVEGSDLIETHIINKQINVCSDVHPNPSTPTSIQKVQT